MALIFPNAVNTNKDKVYDDDIWKGTRNVQFSFFLKNNGGSAAVHCMNYSEEHGGQDHLSVTLKTKKQTNLNSSLDKLKISYRKIELT